MVIQEFLHFTLTLMAFVLYNSLIHLHRNFNSRNIIYMIYNLIFFFFQTFITIINNTKVLKYISSVNIYRMQDAKLVL